MAKELDLSGFDEEVSKETELDLSGFDEEIQSEPQEPEKMSALEASLTGVGEGTTFGLGPIAAGLAGAAGEVVEDVGDVLGLTTDAQLREQGFEVEDTEKGLQGLLDAYYKSRDMAIKQQEQAMEDQPAAYIGGNIAGGAATMAIPLGGATKLAQGASKIGKGLGVAKIAPSFAKAAEGVGALSKVGKAAIEGAKAGALTGLGSGKAKVFGEEGIVEGITDVTKETAQGGLVGSIAGGGLSGIGQLGKKVLSGLGKTGVGEAVKTGIEAAKKGLDLTDDEAIVKSVRKNIDDVKGAISKHFGKKSELYDFADEMAVRVEAGEDIDRIIQDYITGKSGDVIPESEKSKLVSFINDLRSMQKGISIAKEKAKQKTELAAAKKIDKLQREVGAELESSTNIDKGLDDLRIMPETEGSIVGTQDKVRIPVAPDEYVDKKVITTAAVPEEAIQGAKLDFDKMKLSESDKLKFFLGNVAFGDKSDPASVKSLAGSLYNKLKEAQMEALSGPKIAENNIKLKKLYDALNVLGIETEEFFSKDPAKQAKNISDIANKLIEKKSIGDLIKTDAFMDFVESAAPGSKKYMNELLDYSKNIAGFAKDTTMETVGLERATIGSLPKAVGKATNVATRTAIEGKEALQNSLKSVFKRVEQQTPDQIINLTTQMANSGIKGVENFIEPLRKAAQMDDRSRKAVLYTLAKQPAFREVIRRIERYVADE